MLIHWIPEKWKRRYRIRFASLPLFLMVLAVFLAVVFVYQFTDLVAEHALFTWLITHLSRD